MSIDERRTVMVVDDDFALARMLRILFQSEGFDVILAHDGQQALDRLDDAQPGLVVLDLQMPVMDGRTFYREFRERGYDTPVILLSAYNSEAARQELGAEAALSKPCDPDMIASKARELIGDPVS